MPRKYTHIKEVEQEIFLMKKEGKTNREIAEYFRFKDKYVVKQLVAQHNRNQRKLEARIVPLKQGRPRKDAPISNESKIEYYKRQLALQKYDTNRLKIENELLRDFLHLAGRK